MIDTATIPDVRAMLAATVRRLRVARHLSLSELARSTGVSKATLSGIETGRANPTTETLAALAAALQVPIAELLQQPPRDEMRIVRMPPARRSRADRAGERLLEAATLRGQVEISELRLPARTLREQPPRTSGSRTHLLVLAGKLIAGPLERISELAAGDYASFPTDVPHSFETIRTPARALLVAHTPT